MKRVLVVGCCGAGKTVLSLKLGEKLHLPVYHLDQLWWLPGWVEDSTDHFDRQLAAVLSQETWIMDGNYNRTLPERLRYADTVIWLDYPRRVCLLRALKRIARFHGTTRPDMTCGCPERFDWEFFRYIWNFNRDMRPKLKEALAGFQGRTVLLETPAAASRFIHGCSSYSPS